MSLLLPVPLPSPPPPPPSELELELDGGIACAQTSKTFQVPLSAAAVESAVERLVIVEEEGEEEAFLEAEAEAAAALAFSLPSASGESTAQAATSPSGRHCQASLMTRIRSGVMSSSSPSVVFRERE